MSGCSYAVRSCGADNEELVSTRPIARMELIFEDSPLLWCRTGGAGQGMHCSQCGACVEPAHEAFHRLARAHGMDEAFAELGAAHVQAFERARASPLSCQERRACGGCGASYCSERCSLLSAASGHAYICGLERGADEDDESGHRALCLRAVALVVHRAVEARTSALQASAELFRGFHAERYTASTHAFRTGSIALAESAMFADTIAPAYMQRLGPTLRLLADTFGAEQRVDVRGVLTEAYLDQLMGTFAVNNLGMTVQSSLEAVSAALEGDPSPAARQLDGDLRSMALASARPLEFESMRCTGLCPTFAKMNHECASATFVSAGGGRACMVRVHANRDLAAGAGITSSYLHLGGDAAVTKAQRRRALCQYLFVCQCALCRSEPSDDEDDY